MPVNKLTLLGKLPQFKCKDGFSGYYCWFNSAIRQEATNRVPLDKRSQAGPSTKFAWGVPPAALPQAKAPQEKPSSAKPNHPLPKSPASQQAKPQAGASSHGVPPPKPKISKLPASDNRPKPVPDDADEYAD